MAAKFRTSESHHDRRRRIVHERILAAAVERIEARGLEATRVDDVCEAAEVAQKTFFNHFPTRQHLVREIAALFLGRVSEFIDEVRRLAGTTDGRIARLFERISTEVESASPMRRTLVVDMIRSLHDDPERNALGEMLRELFASILEEGVRAGEVTDAHSVAVMSQSLSGAFYVLCLDWVSIDGFPFRARARALARFFADAIRPVGAASPRSTVRAAKGKRMPVGAKKRAAPRRAVVPASKAAVQNRKKAT